MEPLGPSPFTKKPIVGCCNKVTHYNILFLSVYSRCALVSFVRSLCSMGVFRSDRWIFVKYRMGSDNRVNNQVITRRQMQVVLLWQSCIEVPNFPSPTETVVSSHETYIILIMVLILLTKPSSECCLPTIMGDIYIYIYSRFFFLLHLPFFPSLLVIVLTWRPFLLATRHQSNLEAQ
jgi:hypothetical protein